MEENKQSFSINNPEISQPVVSEVKVAPAVLISTTSSNWWKAGILLVGLLLAASIAYAGWQFSQKQAVVSQPTPTVQPSPASTPDSTANWKTYKTSKYEVKYPSDWKVNLTPLEGESLFQIIPNSNTDGNFYPGLFIEFKSINNTSLEIQEGIYKRMNLIKSEVFFKSLPAVKYTGVSLTKNADGRMVPGIIQQTFMLLEHSGYIYTFGYSYEESTINKNQEDFFDQILSTFKFLE